MPTGEVSMSAALRTLICLSRVLSVTSIFLISLLAFPILYDVVLRSAGRPTIWAFEITTYALIAGTFLANAHALRDGSHFRVTFLVDTFPRLKPYLDRFALIASLLFGAVLAVSGFDFVQEAFVANLRSPTLLHVPLYLPRLAIPLGAISLMIQAAINLCTPALRTHHEPAGAAPKSAAR
jgi:C4-dicarboxylate transporter DctQ subunit